MENGNATPSVSELGVEFASTLPVTRKRAELRDNNSPSLIHQRPRDVLEPTEVVEAIK